MKASITHRHGILFHLAVAAVLACLTISVVSGCGSEEDYDMFLGDPELADDSSPYPPPPHQKRVCDCSCRCMSCTADVYKECSAGSGMCESCEVVCESACTQNPLCGSFIYGSGHCEDVFEEDYFDEEFEE